MCLDNHELLLYMQEMHLDRLLIYKPESSLMCHWSEPAVIYVVDLHSPLAWLDTIKKQNGGKLATYSGIKWNSTKPVPFTNKAPRYDYHQWPAHITSTAFTTYMDYWALNQWEVMYNGIYPDDVISPVDYSKLQWRMLVQATRSYSCYQYYILGLSWPTTQH